MKLKTLLLFLILLANHSFSQGWGSKLVANDENSTGWVSLNISPLCLLDVYAGSSLRGGIQMRPTHWLSFGADFGTYLTEMTAKLAGWRQMEGFNYRIRAGVFPARTRDYSFGIEYQFKTQSFAYADSTDTEPYFIANVSNRVHCFNIYTAYDLNLTDRLFLDMQFGIGLRYRDISNDKASSFLQSKTWTDVMTSGRVTDGANLIPNLSIAVRLGFALFKNDN